MQQDTDVARVAAALRMPAIRYRSFGNLSSRPGAAPLPETASPPPGPVADAFALILPASPSPVGTPAGLTHAASQPEAGLYAGLAGSPVAEAPLLAAAQAQPPIPAPPPALERAAPPIGLIAAAEALLPARPMPAAPAADLAPRFVLIETLDAHPAATPGARHDVSGGSPAWARTLSGSAASGTAQPLPADRVGTALPDLLRLVAARPADATDASAAAHRSAALPKDYFRPCP